MTTKALNTGKPTRSGAAGWTSWASPVVLLIATAFILRSADLLNPIPGHDEEYYLLFARELLNGALPYVDIWDRKPFGLFLLIVGLTAMGGDAYLFLALGATAAAGATAFLIYRIARRHVSAGPAIGAGVFYLLMLEVLGGDTVQTAVFYNLLVTGAVFALLTPDATQKRTHIIGAMLLLGVAMTIKTIAVFEATAIGLWLIAQIAQRDGAVRAIRCAAVCAAIGLAPTAAIAICFALHGLFDPWWFANFASQFQKTGGFSPESLVRLLHMATTLFSLAAVGALGWLRRQDADRGLLGAWLLATFLQTFVLGNFWPIYALPLAAPAAVLAASTFAVPRLGPAMLAALCLWPATKAIAFDRIHAAKARRTVDEVIRAIPADARRTCLFAYNAPETFYLLSNACLVSPYLFVDQFRSVAEAKALPIDASIALRAALARRPGTILTVDNVYWTQPNRMNDAIIAGMLVSDYRRIATVPWYTSRHNEAIAVWRRNDLPAR